MEDYKKLYEQTQSKMKEFIKRWDGIKLSSNDLFTEELKQIVEIESEDERIRKEIIDNEFVKSLCVEPKFKVGDWVVNKFGDSWHIDSLDKKNYQVSDGKGNYNYFPISKQDEMHLWAIQDAKDGDVLVCDINKAEIGGDVEKLPNIVSTIFNFKKLINTRGYIHSYCHLYDKRFLGLQSTMYYNSFVYNISPAAKEQRDFLFQKIKESGYEWDADKKELFHNQNQNG